jgi:hypothetical protein
MQFHVFLLLKKKSYNTGQGTNARLQHQKYGCRCFYYVASKHTKRLLLAAYQQASSMMTAHCHRTKLDSVTISGVGGTL